MFFMVFNLDLDLEKMLKCIKWKEPFREFSFLSIRNKIRYDGLDKENIFPFRSQEIYEDCTSYEDAVHITNDVLRYYGFLKKRGIVDIPIPTRGDASIFSEPITNSVIHNKPDKLIIESYHTSPIDLVLGFLVPTQIHGIIECMLKNI